MAGLESESSRALNVFWSIRLKYFHRVKSTWRPFSSEFMLYSFTLHIPITEMKTTSYRMFSFALSAEKRQKDVKIKLYDSFTGSELKGALYSAGLNVCRNCSILEYRLLSERRLLWLQSCLDLSLALRLQKRQIEIETISGWKEGW